MKRIRGTVALVLVLAAYRGADARQLWVGLRGGPSIPQLSGGGNEISRGYSSILAPNFGILVEYPFTQRFSVQAELDYSGQGGQRKGLQPITQSPEGLPPLPAGQYLYADFTSKSILNYLEIPVMAKVRWGAPGQWQWFAEGGPYVGFLLNAEQKTQGTSLIYTDQNRTPLTVEGQALPPMSFDASTDVKDGLRTVNMGITAGVGWSYWATPRSQVFLEVRGEYGLMRIQKDTANGSSNTGSAALLLGYMVCLGH
jgi:hypothetical protein